MAKYCKYYQAEKLVTYNGGLTWHSLEPPEYGTGSLIERNSPDCGYVPPGYDEYLTFETIDSGTFTTPYDVYYSLNNGEKWTFLSASGTTPTVSAGRKIMWKQTRNTFSNPFSSTGRFNVRGNIMSLVYGDNFQNQFNLGEKWGIFERLFRNCTNLVNANYLCLPATTLGNYCYSTMFAGCTSLITAPELYATTLIQGCYNNMFSGCTSLTTAPELPATTLGYYCYGGMFNGCTSLTTPPSVLPATTLAGECYANMFNSCTSLTTAPVLPATTLDERCYVQMFRGCTSLTTAPELPAKTLSAECYRYMFWDCTSLTRAPELPATTLTNGCYWGMFQYCTSLNYVKCLATNISASNCTAAWVNGVASSGTFVKNASMSSWTTGYNGIPSNWTIENA